MEQDAIRQNLLDAGCREDLVNRACDLMAHGKKKEALKLIGKHRKQVLDCCHAEQRKIDCLDYLVYQLEHEGE